MYVRTAKTENELLFKLALVLILCYFVYFCAVVVNLYYTFHEYSDFTLSVYNLYINSQYPQVAHGLQLMMFDEHLSPDSLFLVLAYYIFQSPITLLIIQLAFVCLTACAAYCMR